MISEIHFARNPFCKKSILQNGFQWISMDFPYEYIPAHTRGTYTRGVVKSYSFRTITHPAFNKIYDLFMVEGKKRYQKGTITDHLTSVGQSYSVRDDGTQQKNNEVIQRTMCFTEEENNQMVIEQNKKFKLHRKVIKAKKFFAIYIPASDAPILRKHLVYLPDSMKYKMPVLKGHSSLVSLLKYRNLCTNIIFLKKKMTQSKLPISLLIIINEVVEFIYLMNKRKTVKRQSPFFVKRKCALGELSVFTVLRRNIFID